MASFESEITDPRVYHAKFVFKKNSDPDSHTFREAKGGIEADKYIEAMNEEIINLKHMNILILAD